MSAPTYGCHVDLEPGQSPDGCVIDTNRRQDCVYAGNIERKEQCKYWQPIAILAAAPEIAPTVASYEEDPMGIVRTFVVIADRMKSLSNEQREHYPSPLSDDSPVMMAARNACVERGFTEGGLSLPAAPATGAAK